MESKNIKVIDEHGIDREANIICGFNLSGQQYVLYWIERDSDNDNLFASKLLKNNDDTFNMINIEDAMEKSKISDIIKQLITYAINSDDDVTNGVVTLGNDIVEINSVLFNREQNINVTKTYITTVKKNVTKVGEDFYKINNVSVEVPSEPLFNDVFEPLSNNINNSTESISIGNAVSENEAENFMNSVLSVPKVEDTSIDSLVNDVTTVTNDNNNQLGSLNVANNDEVNNLQTQTTVAFDTNLVNSNVNDNNNNNISLEVPTANTDSNISNVVPNAIPVTPVVNPVPVEPILDVQTNQSPNNNINSNLNDLPKEETVPLVFDGAKETNLNIALGDVDKNVDAVTPVNDVEALRKFGQHDSIESNTLENVNDKVPQTNNGGFANKKFFMIIAIVLFIAACCFLGYEAYNYFQLTAK